MGERFVIIGPAKMRKWMYEKEFSGAYVSQLLGRSYNYISSVLSTRKMSLTTYRLLKKEFGLTDSEILKEENTEPAPASLCFSVELQIRPDRVKFSLLHNGAEMYSAFSRIQGKREVDLVKAISYAAHLCYKFAEQKEIGGNHAQ